MKKLVSMLLALAMVLTLAGGAMAETKDYSGYTIRIYSNSNSTERTTWLIQEAKDAGFTISIDDNSVISGDTAAIQAANENKDGDILFGLNETRWSQVVDGVYENLKLVDWTPTWAGEVGEYAYPGAAYGLVIQNVLMLYRNDELGTNGEKLHFQHWADIVDCGYTWYRQNKVGGTTNANINSAMLYAFTDPTSPAGGISVGSLFLAGYLPGALLAIVLMIGSYIISVKRNYPKGDPFSIKAFVKQLGTSIWALAAVIIVVFGVVGGVFTATESAAIAVIYSLLVSVFVYKGLDWKGVWHALDECVNTLSIVLILIATSAVFGNCLTMLHVPDLAATAITDLTDNPYIIALLIDLILLVLGMIMDMAPIILIATPILLPIATSIGIDPIQFGIIVVLNCGIGLLTPPVGSVLFIGSAVAKRPMEKVVKATLPFYLCMFIALLLLTYIPDISLAIPKLLGGYVSPIANPLGPVFIH